MKRAYIVCAFFCAPQVLVGMDQTNGGLNGIIRGGGVVPDHYGHLFAEQMTKETALLHISSVLPFFNSLDPQESDNLSAITEFVERMKSDELLSFNTSVNYQATEPAGTILHFATFFNKHSLVASLLAAGMSPDVRDADNQKPIKIAYDREAVAPLVFLLLADSCPENVQNEFTLSPRITGAQKSITHQIWHGASLFLQAKEGWKQRRELSSVLEEKENSDSFIEKLVRESNTPTPVKKQGSLSKIRSWVSGRKIAG